MKQINNSKKSDNYISTLSVSIVEKTQQNDQNKPYNKESFSPLDNNFEFPFFIKCS